MNKISAQLESESFIKAKVFSSCKDNRHHPEVPSMAISAMQYICLPVITTPESEIYGLPRNNPTTESIWLKYFHYTGLCLALNLLPALVHASIAMNPLKIVELQQHKPIVSLPLVESSVKTEVTFLSWSLLRPAETKWSQCHYCWIFNQKITGVGKTATAETDQVPTALSPFI